MNSAPPPLADRAADDPIAVIATAKKTRLSAPDLLGDASQATPFVKWVGGKRALLPELLSRLPGQIVNYFEPCAGGGALFYALAPRIEGRALLLDHNAELVNAYQVVRDQPELLLAALRAHAAGNNVEYYYAVRAQEPSDAVARAARLIYLNRTGFNGLYRVNAKGQFNVSYGAHTNPSIADEARIRNAAAALARAQVRHADFASIEDEVASGDFVYFDPPYAPLEATSFTKYTAGNFGPADQERLLALALRLSEKGVLVMLSNSKTPYTEALYQHPALRAVTVMVPRFVNRDASKRGAIAEILVTNYEPGASKTGLRPQGGTA